MTSTTASTATAFIEQAAAAAARTLPVSEPLSLDPIDVASAPLAGLAGAVVLAFTGAASGELALLIDQATLSALPPMAIAADDLPAALRSVTDEIMAALGTVVAGVGQRVDSRLAVQRCTAHADHAAMALQTATGLRAALVIGVDDSADGRTGGIAGGAPRATGTERLDLLRGVEMQASAELGRARMTISELLSLHAGAVIELDRLAGDPADLFVNGRLIARGEVVVVDENYAIRITQIVDAQSDR